MQDNNIIINIDIAYHDTLKALYGCLDSKTSKLDRDQYESYIHHLKHNHEHTCLEILIRILSESNELVCNEYMKLLTLSILNDYINIWWNKVVESKQGYIKQMIWDLTCISDLSCHNSHRSIRSKIAVLLANISERVFPQYWPTMISEFIQVYNMNHHPYNL